MSLKKFLIPEDKIHLFSGIFPGWILRGRAINRFCDEEFFFEFFVSEKPLIKYSASFREFNTKTFSYFIEKKDLFKFTKTTKSISVEEKVEEISQEEFSSSFDDAISFFSKVRFTSKDKSFFIDVYQDNLAFLYVDETKISVVEEYSLGDKLQEVSLDFSPEELLAIERYSYIDHYVNLEYLLQFLDKEIYLFWGSVYSLKEDLLSTRKDMPLMRIAAYGNNRNAFGFIFKAKKDGSPSTLKVNFDVDHQFRLRLYLSQEKAIIGYQKDKDESSKLISNQIQKLISFQKEIENQAQDTLF